MPKDIIDLTKEEKIKEIGIPIVDKIVTRTKSPKMDQQQLKDTSQENVPILGEETTTHKPTQELETTPSKEILDTKELEVWQEIQHVTMDGKKCQY